MNSATALLVIDVQTGMFDEAEPIYRGEALLQTVGGLIEKARAAQIPVIYIQHCDSEGSPLHADSPGWQIHPMIAPQAGETVVQKRHPDSFQETELQDKLAALGIGRLVVAGLQSEYCVDTTCRRAYSLGYEVILVQDGHTTWDTPEVTAEQIIAHHNRTLGSMFATTLSTHEVDFSRVLA